MTQEEKAKAYDEALERARKMLNMILDNELLGFPDQIREIFPQLKESKDEKIREEMIRYFTEMKKGGSAALPYDDCIAYLERQKEQKPAEWNEEDEKKINFLSRLIEFQVKDDEYCFSEGRFVSKQEAIEMLKSLRPSWKPSEEQMEALTNFIVGDEYDAHALAHLWAELKELSE